MILIVSQFLGTLKKVPKYAKNISFDEINTLIEPGVHAIGYVPGLCIKVYSSYRKAYVLRYSFERRTNNILFLGYFDLISIDEAIQKTLTYKALIARNIDPKEYVQTENLKMKAELKLNLSYLAEQQKELDSASKAISGEHKEKEKPITLLAAIDLYLDYMAQCGSFSNNVRAYSEKKGMIVNHIVPAVGKDFLLKDLTPNHVNSVLMKLWDKHAGLSSKLLQFIRKFITWACVNGLHQDIQFKDKLSVLMSPYIHRRAESGHNACLHYSRIPELMEELWSLKTTPALCFMFSILTASRSQAVRCLTWEQVDFEQETWLIPLENDKSKVKNRSRTILLSKEAIAILYYIRRQNEMGDYVFLNIKNGRSLSDSCFLVTIRALNKQRQSAGLELYVDYDNLDESSNPKVITQHGTARSSFKTWTKSDKLGNINKFNQEAVELCLLHERKDPLKGAYDRSTLILERRKVMNEWGKYCCQRIPEFNLL